MLEFIVKKLVELDEFVVGATCFIYKMNALGFKFCFNLVIGTFKKLLLAQHHFSNFYIKILSVAFIALDLFVFNINDALEVGHPDPEKFIEVVRVNS